jgi:MFS family permease
MRAHPNVDDLADGVLTDDVVHELKSSSNEFGTLSFVACCLINIADQGHELTNVVIVPYANSFGATATLIAAALTTRMAMAFFAIPVTACMADAMNGKAVVLITTLGSCLGYLIQGLAGPLGRPRSVALLFIGMSVGGLSKGTAPVLKARISQSSRDPKLVSWRIVVLEICGRLGNLVASPLAGYSAQSALFAPCLIASAYTAVAFAFAVFFYVDIVPRTVTDAESQPSPKATWRLSSISVSRTWTDPVLLFSLASVLFVFVAKSGVELIRPIFVMSAYVLDEESLDQTRANTAKATGWLNFTFACAAVVSALLAKPATDRMRATTLIGIGCVLIPGAWTISAVMANTLWQHLLFDGIAGSGFGLVFVAANVAISAYIDLAHPHAQSSGQAVFVMGYPIGSALGSLMASAIIQDSDDLLWIRSAWLACCASCLASYACFMLAFACIAPHRARLRCKVPDSTDVGGSCGAAEPATIGVSCDGYDESNPSAGVFNISRLPLEGSYLFQSSETSLSLSHVTEKADEVPHNDTVVNEEHSANGNLLEESSARVPALTTDGNDSDKESVVSI